jgi:hypothetical protein
VSDDDDRILVTRHYFLWYCESQDPQVEIPGDHLSIVRPTYRNGHPSNPTMYSMEVGDADEHGGVRMRGPGWPHEPREEWDVVCGVCGRHVRRKEITS